MIGQIDCVTKYRVAVRDYRPGLWGGTKVSNEKRDGSTQPQPDPILILTLTLNRQIKSRPAVPPLILYLPRNSPGRQQH